MLPSERVKRVLDRINSDGNVSAAELAVEFDTSEDTIRRDLRDLAARGLCRRVYGGALRISSASNSAADRATENPTRKRALGECLARLVVPRQFVFIDAGSTNLAAAQSLPLGLNLTVATHDPAIAAVLAGREDIDLIIIGGRVDSFIGAAMGVEAVRAVSRLRPELLLLGACALDGEAGIGAFRSEDAEMKRLLVECSGSVATAVVSEKLSTIAPFWVGAASMLSDLVVEQDASEELVEVMTAHGIRVHRVEP